MRRRPRRWHRTTNLRGTVLITFMGAVLPGSGYLFAGRRLLAYAVLLISLLTAGAVVW